MNASVWFITNVYNEEVRASVLSVYIKQVLIKGHQDKDQKQKNKKHTLPSTFTLMTALLPLRYSHVQQSLTSEFCSYCS